VDLSVGAESIWREVRAFEFSDSDAFNRATDTGVELIGARTTHLNEVYA
jgi:hypothetical protein